MGAFVEAFVVFFVVIDVPGLVPIFLALTRGFEPQRKRLIAFRGTGIALLILAFFAYGGEPLLGLLGIGLPAFRVAGGVLLFWIAFEMLFERRAERKEGVAEAAAARSLDEARDLAVFPLAIPLIAGPGAIASTLLLMGRDGGGLAGQAAVLGALALVLAMTAALLASADRVRLFLGPTVVHTASRVLGILLAALAAQTVLTGLAAIWPPG